MNNTNKSVIRAFISSLGGLGLTYVVSFFSAFFLSFIAWKRHNSPSFPLMVLLGMIASYLTVFILFYFISKKLKKDPLHELNIRNERMTLKSTLTSIVAVAIIMGILSVLIIIFGDGSTASANEITNENTKAITGYHGVFPAFVGLIYPVIIGPFLEELTFRGVIGGMFGIADTDDKLTKVLFILTSAIAFGSMHYQSTGTPFTVISSVAFPTISGAIYAYLHMKNKNIASPIIAHSIYNLSVVIFSII